MTTKYKISKEIKEKKNQELGKDTSITDLESLRNQLIELKDKKFPKLEDKINKDRINVVTLSGLFVAIFTFISIEAQIFKYLCNINQIIFLTMIFGGVLLLFIFIVVFFSKEIIYDNNKNNLTKREIILVVISILLIIGGLVYASCNKDNLICNQISSDKNIISPSFDIKIPDNIKISQ